MGVSHKIYKQEGKFDFQQAHNQLKSILSFCNSGAIMLNARPNSISAITDILSKHKESVKEVEIKVTSEQNDKLNELILSEEVFKFCFIRTRDYHKQDVFGIQLTINHGYKKVDLEIDLPYFNYKESIDNFTSFIKNINNRLCLGFRNNDQVDKEIGQLIQLHFDKEFYDSSWKLHFGSNVYSSAGAAKEMFENNTTKLFRSTGFRIKFPENNEFFRKFTEYAKSILEPTINYFKGEEIDFHFFSCDSSILEKIVHLNPQKIESEIVLNLTKNIINNEILDSNLYEGKGQLNFRIEELNPDEEDEHFFTLEYYGDNFSDLEFVLQIEKNATDEYIEKVLNMFDVQPKFSHLE